MNTDCDAHFSLAAELKALLEMPLNTSSDLDAWDRESDIFRNKLYTKYGTIYDSLPHELEHFLADADIRLKDEEYKKSQNEFILRLIDHLEFKSIKRA